MNDSPSPLDTDRPELRRRCGLVLDLAAEEVRTRRRCAKDGCAGDAADRELGDLEDDLQRARPWIEALPRLIGLLAEPLADWPQFESNTPVPGADLVDWFADWRQRLKATIDPIPASPSTETHAALNAALDGGFVVLTRNRANDPSRAFEAWAYDGPLDFDQATPVRFGLGRDPVEALDALDFQLRHRPDSTDR